MAEHSYPSKVRRTKGSAVRPSTGAALAKLGKDIEFARRVRGISAEKLAEAAGISRSTLHRLESGEGAGVSLNTLAMVLTILGNLELLTNLIDMRNDDVGLSLLRDNVMQGARPAKKTRRQYSASRSVKPGTDGPSKAVPDNAATPDSENLPAQRAHTDAVPSTVISPSGRTSSLLSRLKAARDAAPSQSE